MTINAAYSIPAADLAQYAWAGLRRFQNVSYVEDQICQLHKLDKTKRPNARKQAKQIRYCLLQAREYFDAAASVTLATKPNLLYYSIMSLALAEILFKQSGLSSLDKARAEHRHHGLELRVVGNRADTDNLQQASTGLVAAPLLHANDEGFGTFELWHRSCREMPLAGYTTAFQMTGGSSVGYGVLLSAGDIRLPRIRKNGISLLDCFQALPGMLEFLNTHGIISRLIRGKLTSNVAASPPFAQTIQLIIHPVQHSHVNTFLENISIRCDSVDLVDFRELSTGGVLSFTFDQVRGGPVFSIPPGSMWTENEIRFWPSTEPLNEFGYLYAALFIVGNYARYYPDKWLLDVEQASPLALAVEELLNIVHKRMALLTYSELSRVYYVPNG
jgi:hypothetical protein